MRDKTKLSARRNAAEADTGRRRNFPRPALSIAVAVAIQCGEQLKARAEDHLDYKYEAYLEEKGRIQIHTHSALLEKNIAAWLNLKAEFVYDGISGATPTGGPPLPGRSEVPTVEIDDVRRAGYFEPAFRYGRHTTTPQFAYSLESDYESIGLSLNHAIDFNATNTTLTFGAAHNFDTIMPTFWSDDQHKDSDDFLIGLTQVLSPRTLFTANFTLGTARGYLSDPYKGFRFDGYPDPTRLFAEQRPGHKTKQIAYAALTQFIDPVHASAELAYRFYHDSFGIFSHTASLTWFQKVGKHMILSPTFRYYDQTAASFYTVRSPGDPSDPESWPDLVFPKFYSADYRLAALSTLTYGLGVTVKVHKALSFDAAYKRYEMHGHDRVTAASNFPVANIYTIGFRLWF
ncbi:MAG: DUF3570 domain-containing protein [Verrucomicrobia bacterium]|nr:DUF3570 domain-containing protein [Verrucomicrobiota bacterium]